MSRTSVGVFSVLLLLLVVLCSVSSALSFADRQCPMQRLANGDVTLRNRARIAKYKCARRFKIFGDRSATCLRGIWEYQDQMPVCTRSGCPRMPSPSNGRAQFVRGYIGMVVTFECYPGHSLTGSPAVFCDGVHWNDTAPHCDSHTTLSVETETILVETTPAETTLAETTLAEITFIVETTKAETTTAQTTNITSTTAESTKVTTITAATTTVETTKATTSKATTSKAPTSKDPTSKAPTSKATTSMATTSKATTSKAPTAKASTSKASTAKAIITKTSTVKAITSKATTTTAVAPTSASKECDFEDADLCGWSHATDQHFEWTRHSGPTPSNGVHTGPSWDHTMGRAGAGHYMYTESSSPRLQNDTARLVSPVFDASLSVDACLVFYFHMFGLTVGTLNVYVKPEGRTQRPKIFTLSGQQGNKWVRAVARIDPLDENFQIVIEGVRGSTYLGDMAVDDVRLANGTDCESEATTTQAPIFDADASRSCRGRCFELPPPEAYDATVEGQSVCHCDLACRATSACCEDFEDYCTKFNTWQVAHRVAESRGVSTLALSSALAAGICVLLAAVAAISVWAVRRRRAARTRGHADDESEVRFLTAEEILDFNNAQPKDDDL